MSANEYASNHSEAFEQELLDFLRIPSVSTDPDFAPQCQDAAKWIADNMREAGLTVEIIETERHPIVYGEWLEAGDDKPTVLIYGHYDVQPAVKEDGWDTEPFEPVIKDHVVYARGATDDKGQAFTHVKAIESYLKTVGKLPVNVKVIIEGEEEAGSRGIAKFVDEHADKLSADVCVVSDTSMGNMEQPVIVYSLRGGMAFELIVKGPSADLHSGMFGGTVHNPLQAIAEIIGQLHHEDGRVAIPGFYDDVEKLSEYEREMIAKVPYDNVQWADDTGATLPWGESDYSLQERIGTRPTLEINGLVGGYHGNGFKMIIPSEARAKISCRLVANQNPEKIGELFKKYIKKITPPTIETELIVYRGAVAAKMDIENPMMQAAVKAYASGWGAEPIFKPEGGSIPIVTDFQHKLNLPVILMGFGLNSDGLHGPNEHFSLEMFHKGIQTSIEFLKEVANVKGDD